MTDRRFYMRDVTTKLQNTVAALTRQQSEVMQTADSAASTAKAAATAAANAVTTSTTPFVRAIAIPAQGLATSKDFVIPFYRTLPDTLYTIDAPASSFGISVATVAVKTKTTTSVTITVTTLLALTGGIVSITCHY